MNETIGAVVFRHENGSTIVYDGKNDDGFDLGHIVLADGTVFDTRPIVALLVHGDGWIGQTSSTDVG